MTGSSCEDVELGGAYYGYEDDVYGSCSCGETRRHRHVPTDIGSSTGGTDG